MPNQTGPRFGIANSWSMIFSENRFTLSGSCSSACPSPYSGLVPDTSATVVAGLLPSIANFFFASASQAA
jgi:hypothetical protein